MKSLTGKLVWIFAILALICIAFFYPITGIIKNIALNFSPDKSVKDSTIETLFILLITNLIAGSVVSYLAAYRKVFESKENRNIAFLIFLEYLFLLTARLFQYNLLTDSEYDILAYVNGFQLLLASFLSAVIFGKIKNWGREKCIWLIFSAGFLYLCLDELLSIHEYLGNIVIYSAVKGTWFGYFLKNFFTDPNDFIILTYFILGAVFVVIFYNVFFRYYKEHKKASWFFLVAYGLMAIQIVSENNAWYFLEESCEIMASLCFIISVYLFNKHRKK